MRILHVADLHFDLEHYAWLEKQTKEYDLIAVAGDALDRFHHETSMFSQQQLVGGALRQLARKCEWLAICSGNHDLRQGETWMESLRSFPNCIMDGANRVIHRMPCPVLVTCCPWVDPDDEDGLERTDSLLREGAMLRRKHKATWVILHHSPPGYGPEGKPLVRTIRTDKPDYVLSGHDHRTPFVGSPFVPMGTTLCLNPGSPAKARRLALPPYIAIDTVQRSVKWQWGEKQIAPEP